MQRMRFAGLFLPLITLCAPALSQDAPATAPVQRTPAADWIVPPKPRDFRIPLYPASEREANNNGCVDVTLVVSGDGLESRHMHNLKSVDRNYAI